MWWTAALQASTQHLLMNLRLLRSFWQLWSWWHAMCRDQQGDAARSQHHFLQSPGGPVARIQQRNMDSVPLCTCSAAPRAPDHEGCSPRAQGQAIHKMRS